MERLQAAIEKAREQRKSRQPNSNDRVLVSSGPDDPNSVQMAWLELPEIKLRPRSLLHNRVPAFQNGPAAAPYDILRTRFIQQAKANNWRRIAVVSPHSNCGKTTTVVNLGFGLARQGEIRSIALDFDLRRGRLGRLLRQKSSVPMADVLQGQVPFSQVGWRYGEKLIFGLGHGSSPKSSEILQATSTKTVLENIAFPLQVKGRKTRESMDRAMQMIELVGLHGRQNYFPRQLSGGQQQRVGIARSLAIEPDIWFLDEPFSALDPLIRKEMQDEFLRLQKVLHKTILFVTHDFDEALRLADRIAIMKNGIIEQLDTPANIVLNPRTEYVRKFTEDVPREKVLRVVSVMEAPAAGETPGELRVPGDALIEDVAEDVLGQSLPVGVVDGSGALVGVLREVVDGVRDRERDDLGPGHQHRVDRRHDRADLELLPFDLRAEEHREVVVAQAARFASLLSLDDDLGDPRHQGDTRLVVGLRRADLTGLALEERRHLIA